MYMFDLSASTLHKNLLQSKLPSASIPVDVVPNTESIVERKVYFVSRSKNTQR